ncbi:MAG: hypothetical protein GY938_11185, partial [Ketobacter sp.]|nr:hypothetical protein [Ketobacter sp.]
MFLPWEICSALRPPSVGALHAVMYEVTGQKSADGIVVDSFDEAKARSQERDAPIRLCA